MLEPLGDRVVHRGWLPDPLYRDLLCRADVVLASARQENFGIAVVEAVAAGCVPVVPDAMAYPETITERDLRYPPGRLTTQLRQVLGELARWRERVAPLRDDLARFDWSEVAPLDDDALRSLVDARSRHGGRG
jgi:glycosyltransferase involved in cell wall biosynthesis